MKEGKPMTYIRWFGEIRAAGIGLVGGKAANLGDAASAGLTLRSALSPGS
jgi:phosphoenolpyruvate synthase/pyruvate phosphate dikinase